MLNKFTAVIRTAALGLSAATLLTGCVLAPQTIQLNESYALEKASISPQRDALVRVVDKRASRLELNGNVLGHRGGRLPENSPLLAQDELSRILTSRLQSSLKQLGFGSASPLPAVKIQLDINQFEFSCNEGVLVSKCGMEMAFLLTVIDGGKTFTKPYSINESRRLAASPNKEYNQQWVNEVLDKLWKHIFNDKELRRVLAVKPPSSGSSEKTR